MLHVVARLVPLVLLASEVASTPGRQRVEMPWAGLEATVPADFVPWGSPPWLTYASREARLELRLVDVPAAAVGRPLADQLAALAAAEAASAPPSSAGRTARVETRREEPFVTAAGLVGRLVLVDVEPGSTVRASFYVLTSDRRLFAYEVVFSSPVTAETVARWDAVVRGGLASLAATAGSPSDRASAAATAGPTGPPQSPR